MILLILFNHLCHYFGGKLMAEVCMQDIQKFTVRMPKELYDRLKEHSDNCYIPMSRLILIAVNEYLEKQKS